MVKNPPANAGDPGDVGSIPGSRRSPGVDMATHASIRAWKIPWTEELADYSPWDCKESDATEHTYLFSDWETNYLYFRLFDIISQILKASFWV